MQRTFFPSILFTIIASLSTTLADTFVAPSFVDYVDVDQNGSLSVGDDVDWTSTNLGSRPYLTFGQDAFTSIQEAIDAVSFGQKVHIAAGHYFEESTISITKSVTILGDGAKITEIRGHPIEDDTQVGTYQVFGISGEFDVHLDGLSIVRGTGGIVHRDGNLTVSRCSISGNTATAGGGISTSAGTLLVNDSTLYNNTVVGRTAYSPISGNYYIYGLGGGIYSFSSLKVINSTVSGNAAEYGGGVYHTNSNEVAAIVNSTIVLNEAKRFPASGNNVTVGLGGGISTGATATVSLANSIVAGNTADISHPDVRRNFISNGGNFIGMDDSENSVFANDTATAHSLREDLVAYWPFDSSLTDYLGKHDGTLMGSATEFFGPGKFGAGIALGVNGDDYIEVPNEEAFDFSQGEGFSVSAWCRPDDFTKDWQALIAKGEGASWRIHRHHGNSFMSANAGGILGDLPYVDQTRTFITPPVTVLHIVLVSSPTESTSSLYVNGQLEAQGSYLPLDNNSHPLLIGENPGALGRSWQGVIDDVAIWARPLSTDEIDQIWNNDFGNSIGDLIAHPTIPIDQVIDPNLTNNGGPTLTHALVPSSPAIDAGQNAGALDSQGGQLTTDQRGAAFHRIRGSSVDIGAVEYCAAATWVARAEDFIIDIDNGNVGLDAGDSVTWESQTQGNQSGLTLGFNAFTSIEGAIEATCAGGTIKIGQGTYVTVATINDSILTIQGDGPNSTFIDGLGAVRPFTIIDSTVKISGLTLRNGAATDGAAIQSTGGNLQIDRCSLAQNRASNRGGAVALSEGSLRITNSTLSGNHANTGGGVHASNASVTIVNSTFSTNEAGSGGGVHNQAGSIQAFNSTFTKNAALGLPGETGLGGGLWHEGASTLLIHNSIVAGNLASSGPDIHSISPLMSNGANFIGDTTGIENSQSLSDPSFASTSTSLSQVLDPILANNGGATKTHALPFGSPAIGRAVTADAIDPIDSVIGNSNDIRLLNDQRGPGYPRQRHAAVDIGATEFCRRYTWVAENVDVVTDNGTPGLGPDDIVNVQSSRFGPQGGLVFGFNAFTSIQDAIDATECDPHTVRIVQGSYSEGATITITKDITIQGDGANTTKIDGADTHRVFDIPAGIHDVTLDGLTIKRGRTSFTGTNADNDDNRRGAGIRTFSKGRLTITYCSILDNNAAQDGGGLYSYKTGPVTITNCLIAQNRANWGGGIYTLGGATSITETSISNNMAFDSGGGIFNRKNETTILESIISSNTSVNQGGGLYSWEGSITVDDCIVSSNTTTEHGGGIYNAVSIATISRCTFSLNQTTEHRGGAIFNKNAQADFTNCSFETNHASEHGGGIYNEGPQAETTVIDTKLRGNTAGVDGGGLHNFDSAMMTVQSCHIVDNQAKFGAGIYSRRNCETTVRNCTLANNTAKIYGGGIYNGPSSITSIASTTISGNVLTGPPEGPTWPVVQGSGICSIGSGFNIAHVSVVHSTIAHNSITYLRSIDANTGPVGVGIAAEDPSGIWLANSIVVNPTDDSQLYHDIVAAYTSNENNFVGNVPVSIPGGPVTPSDLTFESTGLTEVHQIIRPLEDNGGPFPTHNLAHNSPAINAGNNAPVDHLGNPVMLTHDQREYPRQIGSHVDLGSVEAGKAGTYERWAAMVMPVGVGLDFEGDLDNDGDNNGFEFGVNSDVATPDSDSLRKPHLVTYANGSADIVFGFRPGNSNLIWIVERSPNLVRFDEIYRFDDGNVTQAPDVIGTVDSADPTKITVFDLHPPSPRSFYQVRIEQKEPWR